MKKFAGLAIAVLAGCFAPVLVAAVRGHLTPVDPGYLERTGRWVLDASVLAQLPTVDPGYLKDFLLIAIAGIAVFSSITSALASRKSQRREVSMVDNFVTTEDYRRTHDATQKQVDNATEDRKADMNRLYTSMHDLSVNVAAHGAKLDIFGQRLTHLDSKLDRYASFNQPKGPPYD